VVRAACRTQPRALIRALGSKVAPVSGVSGYSGTSARLSSSMPSRLAAASTRCSSASFFLFLDATSTCIASSFRVVRGIVLERDRAGSRVRVQRAFLQLDQLVQAALRQVEHGVELRAVELRGLAGALDLHEATGLGHHDVHVHVRPGVLLIRQVEAGSTVEDATATAATGPRS